MLAISILLIYMVTAALFESLKQPLCVLLTVPMALIGVFLIAFLENGLLISGVEPFYRFIAVGLLLIIAVVIDQLFPI